jgi:hypothetical protein
MVIVHTCPLSRHESGNGYATSLTDFNDPVFAIWLLQYYGCAGPSFREITGRHQFHETIPGRMSNRAEMRLHVPEERMARLFFPAQRSQIHLYIKPNVFIYVNIRQESARAIY